MSEWPTSPFNILTLFILFLFLLVLILFAAGKIWFDVIWFVVRQLDIVIDNVASTVLILEAVQSSMNKMNDEELNAFHLDANLGGTSAVLQRKSVERCVSLTAFMTVFDNSTFWLEFCYFYVHEVCSLDTVQPGLTRNVPSIVFIVMQWLSQSASPSHSTCPDCLSQPYLITGLTGSNADNSMNSAFFFVKLLLLPAVASEEVSLYCYVKGKVKFIILY